MTKRSPASGQNCSAASPALLKTYFNEVLSDVSTETIKRAFARLDQLTFESREAAFEAKLTLLIQLLAATEVDLLGSRRRAWSWALEQERSTSGGDESISEVLIDQIDFLIAETLVSFNGDLEELTRAAFSCGADDRFLAYLNQATVEYASATEIN